MEVTSFSEISTPVYQIVRCHIPEVATFYIPSEINIFYISSNLSKPEFIFDLTFIIYIRGIKMYGSV
jgi:hypothetical protein